ncbi:MAG TPA: VCBS repeat-containing protein, partial [Flavihumibacter sp.]|nr:VCBS repeat-containing protein [Flavihumibacter sp.]
TKKGIRSVTVDDIYIGNDFHENDYYYINNGNGSFTESGAKHFMHYSRFSMGNDVADIDNDGQPDLVTVDMLPPDEKILKTYGSDENADTYEYKLTRHGYQQQVSRNCLQRNNGKGSSFSERALLSNIAATDWSWSPLFADLDNDGNKDLLITSGIVKRPVDLDYIKFVSDLVMKTEERDAGKLDKIAIDKMPDGASHPFLFRGNGNADFNDVSEDWGTAALTGYHNGAAYADFDNDGDLDIVINNLLAPAILLQNNATPKHSITINCKGTGANPFGIGTKIWVFAAGKTQYQELQPVRGFQSSSDHRLHFGLDSMAVADSLLIVWPDQHYQVLKQVPVKGFITVNQQEAIAGFDYDRQFPPPAPLLENMTGQWSSPWKHMENNFVDYNKQYLIPHALSTLGPKMAVTDVDGDGLDDIYVCGAAGQSGQLLLQRGNGFVKGDSTAFNRHAAAEENDASFFDANGDGYPDLVVVTGGNEKTDGDSLLADHL